MKSLQKSRFFQSVVVFLILSGCTVPPYKILNQDDQRVELLVAPDRVILECEDVQDPTEKPSNSLGRFGFMIHVLDEANTVLSVTQGSVQDKRSCLKRVEEVEKVLRHGKQIYIGGIGNLTGPRVREKWNHYFPGKGVFFSNSRALQFMVIANEKGECYSAYYGTEKPCPREEFPIK
jgi:hypothetical protein